MKFLQYTIISLFIVTSSIFAVDNTLNEQLSTAFVGTDKKSPEQIKALIDKGADPNAIDKYGWPVLMRAAQMGYTDIVKLLLDKGAHIQVQNNNKTPLMAAVSRAISPSKTVPEIFEIVKLLLEKGAQINDQDIRGATALAMVALEKYDTHEQRQQHELIKLLISKGADVNLAKQYIEGIKKGSLDYYKENPEMLFLEEREHSSAEIAEKTKEKTQEIENYYQHALDLLK